MDDWRPSATFEILKLRAQIRARIHDFFAHRGVLEVETPILSAAATPDPALHSFATRFTGPGAPRGKTLYMHTSPEYPMKRLLAAGSGDIYQLCKVFRDGESGRFGSFHQGAVSLLTQRRVRDAFDVTKAHARVLDRLRATG